MDKVFRLLLSLISELIEAGALGSDEADELRKALKELRHALSTKQISLVEKAIDKITRVLVRA